MQRTVAIYARVSTEHEAQLSALDNQVQYYDNILKNHPDWILYNKYIDEGITGTSTKKRKHFMRMIEDAEDGKFDLIITREVSRFARNTVDTLQETRKLKRIGVEVYFTEDNIWTFNDDDGELKLTIMATLAQNESKKTSQRVKAGQKISFQNGVFYGTGNILGYDKVGKSMVVNEEQAKVVRHIFKSFLDGKGTTDIKYELETKGYKTATGLSVWNPSTIVRILRNPFYKGTIVYRKSFIVDYLEQKPKKNTGQVEQVVVEGTHEPLISKEDFDKAQLILLTHSQKLQKKAGHGVAIPQCVWSRKLKCSCGSSFNRMVYHKYDDKRTYQYICYHQKNYGSKSARIKRGLDTDGACDIPLVQEWLLRLMANYIFDAIWQNKDTIIELANKIIDKTIEEESYKDSLEEEIKEYETKLKIVDNKYEKVLDMYLNELITKDNYIKKKKDIEKSIEDINNKIFELKNKRGIPKDIIKSKLQMLKNSILTNLKNSNEEISDDLVESFVEKIIIEKDSYKWKLNYLNDMLNVSSLSKVKTRELESEENDMFLTRIIITNDEKEKYAKKLLDYEFIKSKKLKQDIIVDVYV